ncbi:2-hydroxypenta-2,4-dienoate hydratase [Glutamicibacter ectropisis]|uniref:2-hydroxypenta-2,4-dienoate hydratase n=1 Tax=Glutamicibacter ectropisis TaxID=3046593 RepID=A0AAU6WGL8_9MICC
MPINIAETAQRLIEAKASGTPVDTLITEDMGPSTEDAFRVQQELVRRAIEDGDAVAGFKLGNIAKAMQDKFGVDEPDYGYILASQFYPENLAIKQSEFIEPFIELEPGFVLKKDLYGKHVHAAEVIAATDFVIPALEIIDSRIKNWNISLFDTLADNGSIGGILVGGQPRKLSEVNLADTVGIIEYDGKEVARGNTNAVYGNPIGAIAWLVRRISAYGVGLKAGQFILPGSCLAAEKMIPGTSITGRFEGWGELSFEYTATK